MYETQKQVYCEKKTGLCRLVRYILHTDKTNAEMIIEIQKVAIDYQKVAIDPENPAIDPKNRLLTLEIRLLTLKIRLLNPQINLLRTQLILFNEFKYEGVFGRNDIAKLISISYSSAGDLISKLKDSGLIIEVKGQGKGKYCFAKKKN